MPDDPTKTHGGGFSKLSPAPQSSSEHFSELKNYDDGSLWSYLNAIRPETGLGIEELPPRILFHYTDVNGLRGIVDSNSVRASAAYYLNDSSEVEYGCALVVAELKRWVELNRGQKTFAATVLEALYRLFDNDPSSKISRSANIYVTCFCEEDNLLSQWRAYGQKGGYSLGFWVEGLRKGMAAPAPYHALRLAKVIYDRSLQAFRIQSIIKQAIIRVGESIEAKAYGGGSFTYFFRDVVVLIQELLLDEIVTFKHPAFIDEREWRLIARFDFRPGLPSTEKSGVPIHKFRQAGGYVLPYIELTPKSGKIPLVSVSFGPSLDFERYQNPIKFLLALKGFSDVEVQGSDLPVIL